MHSLVHDLHEPKPIRIWLEEGLASSLSRLDGYTRSTLATTMRTELARILRLRSCTPCNGYQKYVELGGGFLTVIAIEDDVYFDYHVGEPSTLYRLDRP
jgi:hypothetical protein